MFTRLVAVDLFSIFPFPLVVVTIKKCFFGDGRSSWQCGNFFYLAQHFFKEWKLHRRKILCWFFFFVFAFLCGFMWVTMMGGGEWEMNERRKINVNYVNVGQWAVECEIFLVKRFALRKNLEKFSFSSQKLKFHKKKNQKKIKIDDEKR